VADAAGPVDFAALQRRLDEAEDVLAGRRTPEERLRVLEERGRAVAPARTEAVAEGVPVLAFRVGGERYAVAVAAVFQVLDARGLSPLPACPPWLLGAMVARTRVVPVLDLRALLGLDGGGMSDLSKVVVVEHDGDVFGLAAEELEGRLEVPREGLARGGTGPFEWVAPDRLALLDLSRLGAPSGRGG
jgi:purine-binding chemotaxis protein CheW